MRGLWLVAAVAAVLAAADEPKNKKKEKKPKKQQKQKDCPACPADLSDELAAATKRAEAAEAKTCPEDLSEALAAAETRASIAEEKAVELQKNVDDEIAKVVEAKKDAKHWKAQVDGLEESLKATKAALATSHPEPVVPSLDMDTPGTTGSAWDVARAAFVDCNASSRPST